MAACWKQEPEPAATAAVTLAGWSVAVLRRATHTTISKAVLAIAVIAGLASVALAVLRLPRGLLWPGLSLALLAGFEAVISVRTKKNWTFRISVGVVGFVGLMLLWTAPFHWSPPTRVVLMSLLGYSLVQLIKTPDPSQALTIPLRALRGLIFAAAVIAPSAWYAPGGLPAELVRKENALFAVVCVISALVANIGRGNASAGGPTLSPKGMSWLLVVIVGAAIGLTIVTQHYAQRPVFLSVGVTALALFAGLALHSRCPQWAGVLRESALLAPWAVLLFAPALITR